MTLEEHSKLMEQMAKERHEENDKPYLKKMSNVIVVPYKKMELI